MHYQTYSHDRVCTYYNDWTQMFIKQEEREQERDVHPSKTGQLRRLLTLRGIQCKAIPVTFLVGTNFSDFSE